MLSPSPTQQPPVQSALEQKRPVRSTPMRKQSPTARLVKAIFRPILKGVYYLLTGIREHIALALAIILLFAISITATNYFTTGQLPFGVGNDQFNFHVHGTSGGGDRVKSWVYHLREGNVAALQVDQKDMSQPSDPNQLVQQYSELKNNITWKTINVVGVNVEQDTTIDSFVEIDVVTHGPGGDLKGELIWHFVTASQGGGLLLNADLVGSRIRPAIL
ncbi:MAG: hypothetical protein NVS4B11_32720 [Ktedonobacteraceae bacterium]